MRLAQLDALDQIDVLKRIMNELAARTGQRAQSWQQLARAGAVRGVPVDPSGVPYTLDPNTGAIGVATNSDLWPLPTEPSAAPELSGAAPPVP
jgi:hypothetical protein